jgi:membrane peptidoglycan carboxypeptidase
MRVRAGIAVSLVEAAGYSRWNDLHGRLELAKRESLQDLSLVFFDALIQAEDKRFFQHRGIDFRAIAAIPWRLLRNRTLSGASTITQQLVRTLTGDHRRCIGRKFHEMALSVLLETALSKMEIATLYLSIAYFGWKMNGVAQACRRSGIDLKLASIHQAAALIARLKYPEPRFASKGRYRCIERRRMWILERTLVSGKGAYPQNAAICNVGKV